MKKLTRATGTAAKVLEVIHWVGAAIMIALLIATFFPGDFLADILTHGGEGETTLVTYGFEVTVMDGASALSTLRVFAPGAAILLGLFAMIFRNIYLIMRRSEGGTPFQKDNVRMVREIGFFSIAVPVVSFVMSVIARLVLGADAAEISMNVEGVMYGLVALCLSQFFAHGMELEADVDGLL